MPLTTAVRVFTTRRPTRSKTAPEKERATGELPTGRLVKRRYPNEALVFDTETLPGPAQELRVLVWRFYRDRADGAPGTTCVEEGIAYPDDMPDTDPAGFSAVTGYATGNGARVSAGFPVGLRCEPLSWWLEKRLRGYGYEHRNRCSVVGFNLLFDLGRLASYWAPAGGAYLGGFSFGIWGAFNSQGEWRDWRHHPRLRIRAIDPRRSLIDWGYVKREDAKNLGRGRFVDLRTLAFALTDCPHTLEKACAAFGDPYEKSPVEFDELTPELLDYARSDVEHTALLYRNCLTELRRHEGVDLQPHRLYSPATVGARYLDALGLRRPLVKFTGLTDQQLGWAQPDSEPDATAAAEQRRSRPTPSGLRDERLLRRQGGSKDRPHPRPGRARRFHLHVPVGERADRHLVAPLR